MLDIDYKWNLPQINYDLSSYMKKVEELMLASVQMNLSMGGRPPFQVKHPNETPLTGSGKMYAGLRSASDESSATVYMDSSVVSKKGFFYPQALNDGAEIPPVQGKLMVFEMDGHTIFTYKRVGFHLGPFPFMIFQEQDKQRILEMLPDAIFMEQGEIQ